MDLPTYMSERLGRALTAEETQCLRRLTVQGVARINFDAAKGVPVEETMQLLLKVYQAMLQRRQDTLSAIPEEVRQLVPSTTESTLTVDQWTFLAECHQANGLQSLLDAEGHLAQDMDLENCTLAHIFDFMVAERPAKYATGARKAKVTLAPMECPEDWDDLLRPRYMIFRGDGIMAFRLCPVVAWFNELEDENVQITVIGETPVPETVIEPVSSFVEPEVEPTSRQPCLLPPLATIGLKRDSLMAVQSYPGNQPSSSCSPSNSPLSSAMVLSPVFSFPSTAPALSSTNSLDELCELEEQANAASKRPSIKRKSLPGAARPAPKHVTFSVEEVEPSTRSSPPHMYSI